jgi:hypothetical protein
MKINLFQKVLSLYIIHLKVVIQIPILILYLQRVEIGLEMKYLKQKFAGS